MSDLAAWISAIAAVSSAVAAALAACAAKSSRSAADKMALIEIARRHQELTPQVAVTLAPLNPGDVQCYRLTIELRGPIALQRVGRLSIRVRDDRPGRATEPVSFQGNSATPEQLAAQIWGPLRLTPNLYHGSDRVDEVGRSIDIGGTLNIGDSVALQMEATSPPPWTSNDRTSAESWWQDTVGGLVRIVVTLWPKSSGSGVGSAAAWIVPIDVPLDAAASENGVTVNI